MQVTFPVTCNGVKFTVLHRYKALIVPTGSGECVQQPGHTPSSDTGILSTRGKVSQRSPREPDMTLITSHMIVAVWCGMLSHSSRSVAVGELTCDCSIFVLIILFY